MLVEDVVLPGLMVLRSPALCARGVPHAFSTRRAGGLSDECALARAVGLPTRRVLSLRQVHGAAVRRPAPPGEQPPLLPCGDGLVSDRPGDVLRVVTADCVPVLIATDDGRDVAAVHAGWRGLLAGVISATLLELDGLQSRPGFAAAIGPCLSPARFEVGPEVAAAFEAAGHAAHVVPGAGDRSHVDLRAVAAAQLSAGGVDQIEVSAACTWNARVDGGAPNDPNAEALFHSYRRDVTHGDAKRSGHQLALITPAPGRGASAR